LPDKVLDDAIAIARAITEPDCGLFASANVVQLDQQGATRTGILSALDDLGRASTTASTVLVYFSCHGGSILAGPSAGCSPLPSDVDPRPEAALVHSAISGDELTAWLRRLSAGRALVILDCCHAGGIGSPKAISPGITVSGFRQGFTAADHGALVAGHDR